MDTKFKIVLVVLGCWLAAFAGFWLEPISLAAQKAPPNMQRFEEVFRISPYPGEYVVPEGGPLARGEWCRTSGDFIALQYVKGLDSWIWTHWGPRERLFRPFTQSGGGAAWQAKSWSCSNDQIQVAIWRLEWLWKYGYAGTNDPLNNLDPPRVTLEEPQG